MKSGRIDWTIVIIAILAIALTAGTSQIPSWIKYSSQIAIAAALASAGVMILLRAGLLSFGQGLFYFIGAYAVALLPRYLGVTDAIVATLVGGLAAGLFAVLIGLFIARYRGIFFAMLTLAISMVVYGIAVKVRLFGGSDGLNLNQITFFGYRPRGAELQWAAFLLCVWTGAVLAILTRLLLRSRFGKIIEAIEDNEVRVEYLGRSVRNTLHVVYIVAAVLGGTGGALAGIAARHVDPNFAYWTTGGEFVFVALLSGQASVLSPFVGSIFLELLRTFAASLFPDEWQLVQGAVMLVIILFLPSGLGHLVVVAVRAIRVMLTRIAASGNPSREHVKS